jgi:hypothetical protein
MMIVEEISEQKSALIFNRSKQAFRHRQNWVDEGTAAMRFVPVVHWQSKYAR